tara:strand:- start:480 stop:1664 length:1185 start_codon:yes stop_codon:yes gene_type:complete
MKTHSKSILIVTTLLFFLLIICVFDKYFYQKNKKIIETFDNHSYTKFNETVVPNSFEHVMEEGNLDQCKKNCDDDDKCIGFNRENVDDDKNAECNLFYEIDQCLSENKKPSANLSLSPTASSDYQKYNTYLKNQDIDKYNIQRMKCLNLNELVSLKHTKYPFDLIYQNDDGSLEMNKLQNSSPDVEKVKGVVKIVKGLSGSGVSFMVLKGKEEYYLVNHKSKEEVILEQKIDGGQFNKDASFDIDIQYSQDSNLFSIRKMVDNTDLYWKVNQTNKKIVMTNINDIDKKSPILFQTVHPLIDTFNIKPLEVPAPSLEEEPEKVEEDIREEKQSELEQLELEIREVQHKQNMKLMDIMLDVNKFKLMDLSMSDYLTKCNRASGEELIRVVPVESPN